MRQSFFRHLCGEIHWSPPGWARWLGAHRGVSVLSFVLFLALLVGSWQLAEWWRNRPQPRQIAVTVLPIPLTPLADPLMPGPMQVQFSDSAAPLSEVEKAVGKGVSLQPPAAGEWRWAGDRLLVFQPKNDWPAGQTYRVRLDRELVRKDVPLDGYELEITTPGFEGTIRAINFYQNPKEPAVRNVTATLEFTHPVRRGELESRLMLAVLGGADLFPKGAGRFSLDYQRNDRVVYLRSAPMTLPAREDFARLTLPKGVRPATGSSKTAQEQVAKVKVPDRFSFLRIASVTGDIVRQTDGEPEQVLIIETTAEIDPKLVAGAVEVRLLPERKEGTWQSPREITPEILARSQSVPLSLIPQDRATARTISFKMKLEQSGRLFVRVKRGIEALGGYPLAHNFDTVLSVPEPPQELSFQSEGGLLALGGEHRLSVKSRGLTGIRYEIARVQADQINHLVSQTGGSFSDPYFRSGIFDEENISRLAEETQPIEMGNRFRANYATFDFTRHLALPSDGGSERGLFFLQAAGWDAIEQKTVGPVAASRFILVTDLGLLAKHQADGSARVFVMSVGAGAPVAGVEVELLGKNGVPLATGVTAMDGSVDFGALTGQRREKEPVAFVARLGDDVSFLPYQRHDRELDFSRFEIGGIENLDPRSLDAFAFSERGVYRPGDTVHLAWAVKQRNWGGELDGLPIEVQVTDARGQAALVRRLTLPREAVDTLDFHTRPESPSGPYDFTVYLVRNGDRDIRLGGTTFVVKEFLPDRMKLETKLNRLSSKGWIAPEAVKAELSLRNLYGTPAGGRRIVSKLSLSPAGFSFDEFADYTFYDRLLDREPEPEPQTVELPEQMTSEEGTTEVDFGLEQYASATWQLHYYAEAFEGNSGRCVTGHASALVSAQPWLIGHKPDGDLGFVQVGSRRSISLVAVGPELNRMVLNDLEARVVEQVQLSMLVRQSNGDYAYESVEQEKEVSRAPLAIPAEGLTWILPTAVPGNFLLEIRDAAGERVARVGYRVVGVGELARSLDRNAELEIQLNKSEYEAGEVMQVSIRAPYTGSGLITIESNRVHAQTWFRTDSPSSVQTITLPPDFEGTGYVSVAFVRSLNSREIFMSPLSYGVAPFKADFEKRRVGIELGVPKQVRPGERLEVHYRTDRPAKIMLFAVDEGILQVTNYKTPDPLGWFFRKTRLETRTSQIVDLLIPEFSLLRELSAPGGGEQAKLNPFRRVTEKPVVWWSGLIEADLTDRSQVYEVPDYFSGTLRVMAVAIAPAAVGSAETPVLVRGPFVITPGVPVAVAPGDEFEAGVTVANQSAGSGPDAVVTFEVEPSPGLELVEAAVQELRIPENAEVSTTVRVRVKQQLGGASLRFIASSQGDSSRLSATLSVRPATPFMVELKSRNFRKGTLELPLQGGWHKELYEGTAAISAVPLGLARGLEFYLKTFPHGCTEQITSAAFARLLLAGEADFGQSRSEVQPQMESMYATLRTRQSGGGAFGYWTAEDVNGSDWISVYVMHFLIEAKAGGMQPPEDLIQSGLRHLQVVASREPSSLGEARDIAYAIYVLTREQVVSTNYLLNLQETLDRRWPRLWKSDLTASYVAATWAMLKKENLAQSLIAGYRPGSVPLAECGDFYDSFSADSRHLAVLARHFPDRLRKVTPEQYVKYLEPIGEGNYSTLSAAYAVLALKSFAGLVAAQPPELEMSCDGTRLSVEGELVRRADVPAGAKQLAFAVNGAAGPLGVFAQSMEGGYQLEPPGQAVNEGMEVWRELIDHEGAPVTRITLGRPVTMRIVARSTEKERISNVAVICLVPGGFEVVPESIQAGRSNLPGVDFVEVREDRVILFGELVDAAREWRFQLRPVSKGKFVVPPAFAESMYDRSLKSHGTAGEIEVVQ